MCNHLAKSISRNNIISWKLRNSNEKSLNSKHIVEDSSVQSLTPFDISLTPAKINIKSDINDNVNALKMN